MVMEGTTHNQAPQARLSTVARFPAGYFLENLAIRADNSVLITVINKNELWYVGPQETAAEQSPALLHTFDHAVTGIVEIEPDVFLILGGNFYTTHESFAYRLDLDGWRAGTRIAPTLLCRFPERARALNGCCLIAPAVALVADCFAGLIWRLDLRPNGESPIIGVWLEDDSMGYYPGTMKPEQPGVNGIRFAGKSNYLYYTATAKKLLMRVKVDPNTQNPVGRPELVLAGRMGDDFCIDEAAGVLYLGTHRQNTIDLISLDPATNSGFTQTVAGEPFTNELIGPSGGAWGRKPGEAGRIAFFIMDGGTASPPPGGAQAAQLLKVELQPLPENFPGTGA
jgi:hypothetical protein